MYLAYASATAYLCMDMNIDARLVQNENSVTHDAIKYAFQFNRKQCCADVSISSACD